MSSMESTAPGAGPTGLWRCTHALPLACGKVLPEFELAYRTFGQLDAARSNAILVCPALNASHELCGHDSRGFGHVGWWNGMVGPGKPIDPSRFFIVCVANLGGCFGSTSGHSIDPVTGQPYGPDFPFVTVGDWVESQALLADHLGIERFAAVVGGSLGGMQALQWAISHPRRARHVVVIASAPSLSAQNIAFNEIARLAIQSDPDFCAGRYAPGGDGPRRGLLLARMLGHVTYSSHEGLERKFGRGRRRPQFGFSLEPDFDVESYLHHQGDKFAGCFDANAYLRITKALDYFDPARDHGGGDLAAALAETCAQFLVVSFAQDWRFSPMRSKEIVEALRRSRKRVSYANISGPYGHDGFLLNDVRYLRVMRAYFERVARDVARSSATTAKATRCTSEPPRSVPRS